MGGHILRGVLACLLVVGAVTGVGVAPGGVAAPRVAAGQVDAADDEARLLELHNQERAGRGIPPLQRDPALDAVAREWSVEMARSGDFFHRPDLGEQIERRVTTEWRRWGENIAAGGDVDGLHRALMDSEGHRRNILGVEYNRVGIGAHRDGSGQLWLTVDLLQGPPLPAAPEPSAAPSPTTPTAPAIPTPPRSPDDVDVLVVGPDGAVQALGDTDHLGDARREPLSDPAVAVESAGPGDGYWLATGGGDVLAYGGVDHHGDVGPLDLAAPVVDMAATDGHGGYWLAAADGGIFTHGDAEFLGSAGGLALVASIVAMAPTPSGRGYWLAAADGGVFTYGDARFHGSGTGRLAAATTDIVARDGGYVLVADDGSTLTLGAGGSGLSPALTAPGGVVAAS